MVNLKLNKKILCFVDFYLPGYKAGGPIRSIANFVEKLGDEFDIFIICRDHDLSENRTFENIKINEWNKVGKANVLYLSKNKINFYEITKILKETPYDLMYLNSFFSLRFTLLPLLIYWLKLVPQKLVIIAPRGEFSPGALKIKFIKKKFYIFFVKVFGFYNNLNWQVSSNYEKHDLFLNLNKIVKNNVYVAPNLTTSINENHEKFLKRKKGSLRLIFLSRISPKKNLDFILLLLKNMKCSLSLSIYGVKSDIEYYKYCESLIRDLPSHISIQFKGYIPNHKVSSVFSDHDLFVFPTKGENFGHVVYESLSAGTPVLVSDQTPWKPDKNGSLKVLKLDYEKWLQVIVDWAKFDQNKYIESRHNALKYVTNYEKQSSSLKKNKDFFNLIFNKSNIKH